MKPLVSVVIPTYNRGSLVTAAVDSVLAQTFTDYELIVIDDGSSDDTMQKLGPYMDRIRYFHQANLGASAAQNAGLRAATGEWVAILASDDTWHPAKLERQLEAVGKLGRRCGACFTDCKFVGNPTLTSSAFEDANLQMDSTFGVLENPLYYLWENRYALYVQSLLALRSILNEVGGFDEYLAVAEDRDLLFRLSFVTRFCYVSAPLVNIDRTDGIARLTSSSHVSDRKEFLSHESSLRKMLGHPKLQDGEIRRIIQNELLVLYYNSAAAGIRDLNLGVATEGVKRIHGEGHGFSRIWWTLFVRAVRKLVRRTHRQN